MKCEEYRKAIAADPAYDGGAEHLRECGKCRAYRAEMLALEAKISRALAIEVPDLVIPPLPDAQDDTVVPLRRRRSVMPAWFAVAATVAVAAILGVRMFGAGVQRESLADEVLAHVDHDPAALQVTDVAVSNEQLHAVVPGNIADLDDSAGVITYAQSCIINDHTVPHLVIQGARGPVTVLLMPEEPVGEAVRLTGENVSGVILPVGNGSIAIIGSSDERLESIREQVLKSVTWTT